jgi:hypothetical protein
MKIIKEGMNGGDPNVQQACLQFLTQSILSVEETQISENEL